MNPIIQEDDGIWLAPTMERAKKHCVGFVCSRLTWDKNRWMDYRREFLVKPGREVKLDDIDPGYTGRHESEEKAQARTEKYRAKLTEQQLLMYAEKQHSLLIVLQALDAAGKDGTVKHVMSAMNP